MQVITVPDYLLLHIISLSLYIKVKINLYLKNEQKFDTAIIVEHIYICMMIYIANAYNIV